MEILILFVFGIFIGSFLNVLIDRIPRGEKITRGRSYCESCKKTLQWYDLIPLLSFLQIGGRCRYCRVRLSFYYPIIELTTGILFVLSYLFIPLTNSGVFSPFTTFVISLLYSLFVACVLVVIFYIDLRSGIIPFVIIFPAIFVALLFIFVFNQQFFITHFIGALAGFLFFLALFLGTKGRGMGFGDVVLAFYMGLLLKYPNIILAFYIAFLTGAGVSLILILGKKKKLSGGTIPFGPFLVFGTIISLFFGDFIVREILKTFFL